MTLLLISEIELFYGDVDLTDYLVSCEPREYVITVTDDAVSRRVNQTVDIEDRFDLNVVIKGAPLLNPVGWLVYRDGEDVVLAYIELDRNSNAIAVGALHQKGMAIRLPRKSLRGKFREVGDTIAAGSYTFVFLKTGAQAEDITIGGKFFNLNNDLVNVESGTFTSSFPIPPFPGPIRAIGVLGDSLFG